MNSPSWPPIEGALSWDTSPDNGERMPNIDSHACHGFNGCPPWRSLGMVVRSPPWSAAPPPVSLHLVSAANLVALLRLDLASG